MSDPTRLEIAARVLAGMVASPAYHSTDSTTLATASLIATDALLSAAGEGDFQADHAQRIQADHAQRIHDLHLRLGKVEEWRECCGRLFVPPTPHVDNSPAEDEEAEAFGHTPTEDGGGEWTDEEERIVDAWIFARLSKETEFPGPAAASIVRVFRTHGTPALRRALLDAVRGDGDA